MIDFDFDTTSAAPENIVTLTPSFKAKHVVLDVFAYAVTAGDPNQLSLVKKATYAFDRTDAGWVRDTGATMEHEAGSGAGLMLVQASASGSDLRIACSAICGAPVVRWVLNVNKVEVR